MKQQILIIGGKVQAKSLAQSLILKKYPVTVVSDDYTQCEAMAEIEKLNVIYGNGTSPNVLAQANADKADIAIALGLHDADNLVACELCKKMFGVKKTIALVNDAKKSSFFYQMGVNSVVCATSAINAIIEQNAIANELTTIIPMGEARVTITEVLITKESPIVNMKLVDITLPNQSIIGCILRGVNSIIPRGDTKILENDMLLLISGAAEQQKAIELLTGK